MFNGSIHLVKVCFSHRLAGNDDYVPTVCYYRLAEPGRPSHETLGAVASATAMVGDRLYTDVRFAARNGMTGILVLTGEARRSDIAASRWKPHLVLPTVADILTRM